MFLAIILGIFIGGAHQATVPYQECLQDNFESKACAPSKEMYQAGKFLCDLQGKPFDGSSDCKI